MAWLLYCVFTLQKLVDNNVLMNMEVIKDCLNMLKGAVTIVYPMGLPPHDPIKMEFDNEEDLSGKFCSAYFQSL